MGIDRIQAEEIKAVEEPTPVPVEETRDTPVEKAPEPVEEPTQALIEEIPAPVEETPAPVEEAPAPVVSHFVSPYSSHDFEFPADFENRKKKPRLLRNLLQHQSKKAPRLQLRRLLFHWKSHLLLQLLVFRASQSLYNMLTSQIGGS